jgi:hypothetical protein
MPTVDRCALVIRPKQPYIEWANRLPGVPYSSDVELTVYLAPEFDCREHMQAWLRGEFEAMFERELWNWHTHEPDWPQDRDFVTFQRWFDVDYASMVIDLCELAPLWDDLEV